MTGETGMKFFAMTNDGKELTEAEYNAMTPQERSIYVIYCNRQKPLFAYKGYDDNDASRG